MDEITISRPGDWDSAALTFKARVVPCVDCGRMRRESPHPHAPRWVQSRHGFRLLDCVGRDVGVPRLVTP